MKKETFIPFGDGCLTSNPNKTIVLDSNTDSVFDELEYECMDLIKLYATSFDLKIVDCDDETEQYPISFDLAKEVQEVIMDMFKKAGIKFTTDY